MNGRSFPALLAALILLVLLSPATGSSAERSDPATQSCDSRAGAFLAGRLEVWQQRLKLDGWKISVFLSDPSTLKPDTLGNIHWDADKKTAVIRVLDAEHYTLACPEALNDMEFTIVHELIHLELSSLPRSQASRRDEEHAVNQIADALLKLDRQK
ncbi:MAG: hypothetical protein LAP40_23340 [Acidobacteriia bacterium]|nr:hypothetical protein [Terriglobia bacterium]